MRCVIFIDVHKFTYFFEILHTLNMHSLLIETAQQVGHGCGQRGLPQEH